jgi:hypothetical protein
VTLLFRGLGLLLPMLLLGACAVPGRGGPGPLDGLEAPIELAGTPFFPQDALQCGPAALATVLVAAGRDAHPDALAREIYTPGLGGSLQLELVAGGGGWCGGA